MMRTRARRESGRSRAAVGIPAAGSVVAFMRRSGQPRVLQGGQVKGTRPRLSLLRRKTMRSGAGPEEFRARIQPLLRVASSA